MTIYETKEEKSERVVIHPFVDDTNDGCYRFNEDTLEWQYWSVTEHVWISFMGGFEEGWEYLRKTNEEFGYGCGNRIVWYFDTWAEPQKGDR